MTSLLHHLDRAAAGTGTVHFVRTGDAASWSSMWRDAHARAAWIARTMPADHMVAGVLEPSRACIVTLLGCWLAGRAFASLPHPSRGMDVGEYRQQVEALISSAGTHVVVMPSELSGLLGGERRRDVRQMRYEDFGRLRATTGTDGAALVQFTSGSTDHPRGVRLDMAALGANVGAMAESVRVDGDDVVFSWLPLSHDMGLVGMVLTPVAAFSPELGGASQLWLSDPRHFLGDPLSWLRLASDVGGTVTAAPNVALELVARRSRLRSSDLDLSPLRCLIVGSEAVSAGTLRRFAAATAGHGFHAGALCPAYGLAEATLAVTMVRPGCEWTVLPDPTGVPATPEDAAELVALGRPVPGMRVRTGPGEDGRGEVEVSGPSVAEEFLGRPPAVTADGWLSTGDLGFLRDGELYFTGRRDDRIVVAGRNLDAGALQRRLDSVPGVRAGCCAVVSDGSHDFAVVVEPSSPPGGPDVRDGAELRALCRSVADAAIMYAGARPGRVLVVERGRLPKTPSGKLRAHRLRAGLADGTVAPLAEVTTRRPHAPVPGSSERDCEGAS